MKTAICKAWDKSRDRPFLLCSLGLLAIWRLFNVSFLIKSSVVIHWLWSSCKTLSMAKNIGKMVSNKQLNLGKTYLVSRLLEFSTLPVLAFPQLVHRESDLIHYSQHTPGQLFLNPPSYKFHALPQIPPRYEPTQLPELVSFLPVLGWLCCARHPHQLVGIAIFALQSGYSPTPLTFIPPVEWR